MNKQDKELFEQSKKELELNLGIMIQHSPTQEIMLQLLEIDQKLIQIFNNN